MKLKVIILSVAFGCGWATPCFAPAFMKLGDIKGEVIVAGFADSIAVDSIAHSVSRPAPQPGSPTGSTKTSVAEFRVTKDYDRSSPKIFEAACTGRVLPSMELQLTKVVGDRRATFLKYELKNVLVTSYSVSGSGQDGARPTETFSLNFEEIKVTYTTQDARGGAEDITATYNVLRGQ